MPEVHEQISKLLDKEMDRKRFLQYSATVFLAAFGVSGIINALLSSNKSQPSKGTFKGYGSSKFGKS